MRQRKPQTSTGCHVFRLIRRETLGWWDRCVQTRGVRQKHSSRLLGLGLFQTSSGGVWNLKTSNIVCSWRRQSCNTCAGEADHCLGGLPAAYGRGCIPQDLKSIVHCCPSIKLERQITNQTKKTKKTPNQTNKKPKKQNQTPKPKPQGANSSLRTAPCVENRASPWKPDPSV